MREFMTKMSDYFNEWKEDPEKKENQLSAIVIGIIVVAVIVLLLLFLWWGHGIQEKKRAQAEEKARQLQEAQALEEKEAEVRELEEELEAQGLVATTYEEKMKEYMSRDSGEELRQEYLENTSTLTEKVGELQTVMERVQQEIAKVTNDYRSGDAKVVEKLTVLETGVKSVVENIKNLDSKLADLSNAVQVVDKEKIPALQEQMKEIRSETEQIRTDVSGIREKMKELQKEDERLWSSLNKVEKSLREAMDKNLNEIDTRLDGLDDDIGRMEKEFKEALENAEKKNAQRNEELSKEMAEKMDALSSESLSYRYEKKTNTLYLMPNQEMSGQGVKK